MFEVLSPAPGDTLTGRDCAQAVIKTFEVTEVPVRCVRFIARRNWFVCGSDDFNLRVFNYNTGEKVTALEAHPDYIRCLAVHPTQSLVLTGSDDMTIKLWDWEKGWKCIQVRVLPWESDEGADPRAGIRGAHALHHEPRLQPKRLQHLRIRVPRPHCQGLVSRISHRQLHPGRARQGSQLRRVLPRRRQALHRYDWR